ncbi:hypothetical protein TNCV_3926841 [Trichonephila clavipes]|nr:hypothetical protein TNCV_3926841 [Trichonephila clavipes]
MSDIQRGQIVEARLAGVSATETSQLLGVSRGAGSGESFSTLLKDGNKFVGHTEEEYDRDYLLPSVKHRGGPIMI